MVGSASTIGGSASKLQPSRSTALPIPNVAKEIEAGITELERQLLNLKADDITPALRRHVACRVDELEAAIRHGANSSTSSTNRPTAPIDVSLTLYDGGDSRLREGR